ncbi:hypothetical protein SAY87_026191 [Trapa incisa]|uniref:Protein kinase domain-containing protein n=1 Tax=Trapa incisa TaxID=236973 RepID=A0AAN7GRM4_9MYRT|nr:hypothetical protein SAY87_026191 [Trapa incisa]
MKDETLLNGILEFLKKNKLIKAEFALRTELSNRPDLNGSLRSPDIEEKHPNKVIHLQKVNNYSLKNEFLDHQSGTNAFMELVVREVECRHENNVSKKERKKSVLIKDPGMSTHTSDKSFKVSKGLGERALERVSCKTNCSNCSPSDEASSSHNFPEVTIYEHPVYCSTVVPEDHKDHHISGQENMMFAGKRMDQVNAETKVDKIWMEEREYAKDLDSFKTVLPFYPTGVSTSYISNETSSERKDGRKRVENIDARAAIKEHVDEVGRVLYLRKLKQGLDFENNINFGFTSFLESRKEDLPRLPPVKLKSEDKLLTANWEGKHDQDGNKNDLISLENDSLIGSYLNVPVGRDIKGTGGKRGSNWLSVSQYIAEDTSDLISGFATIGDELSESIGFPNEYWDSDEYEDDDDVGYMRQPIEDEVWFMSHEVDYPSDDEKGIGHRSGPDSQKREPNSDIDDDADKSPSSLSSEKYNGQLICEELNLICSEPVWHGLVSEPNELMMLTDGKFPSSLHGRPRIGDFCTGDDQRGSVRSIGVGITADAEIVSDTQHSSTLTSTANGDELVKWRRRSTDSLSSKGLGGDECAAGAERSQDSSPSNLTSFGYPDRELAAKEAYAVGDDDAREEILADFIEDEEAAAVQAQVRHIKTQEEEFETFNLKIVHRKHRTGFEEDKNFNVVLNTVIAGRYHVTEYLGSAAFSKAVQAHDLQTGMDVCVKIIKNNKDFFDQSLDEIKLLKYINKHDPADQFHILRLYDYFYYREHLLIICELLKANLYEFHKFNRESGGEVYFTMPRLQSITIQCLEALQFLHGLGLIHTDLKPENILIKSYSRCEVKVIDLGSSCFETDHLCSYVQSRSYRAPEVILGFPYNQKIDIWSLGCILAELCTGNVLFQNDSLATLLARVIGIIGPIDQGMLARGRDTYKYFTKNHMLYERSQESNRLEYLIPKRSSLRHRLAMGDRGFVEFVSHLLDINPDRRPTASDALKHPWLSYPYEPISS